MTASRFWFGVLGLALAFAVLVLELAVSMHDRLGVRMVSEGLLADSRVVSWYLKNAAREDAAQLIRFAANDAVARALASASRATDPAEIDGATRRQLKATLSKIAGEMPKSEGFDALFAVAQSGEVIAHIGFDQAINSPDFELGGYPVVADALHGYVRDDTLMFDRVYRVVARPGEFELGQLPAGASSARTSSTTPLPTSSQSARAQPSLSTPPASAWRRECRPASTTRRSTSS